MWCTRKLIKILSKRLEMNKFMWTLSYIDYVESEDSEVELCLICDNLFMYSRNNTRTIFSVMCQEISSWYLEVS